MAALPMVRNEVPDNQAPAAAGRALPVGARPRAVADRRALASAALMAGSELVLWGLGAIALVAAARLVS